MEAKLPTALDSQPGIHLRPSEADDGFPRATASLLAHMANNGFRPKTIQWDGEPHRFPGKDQRRDDSWLRLGRISDALSDDEERAKSAKRPNPKADPNPDYKHRPWAQWLKRAEAGTLASTEAAVGHVKRGGLVGLVPGVHGLAVLDVDTGDPSDLEHRYPPLAKAATRRGAHLIYAAPDKRPVSPLEKGCRSKQGRPRTRRARPCNRMIGERPCGRLTAPCDHASCVRNPAHCGQPDLATRVLWGTLAKLVHRTGYPTARMSGGAQRRARERLV